MFLLSLMGRQLIANALASPAQPKDRSKMGTGLCKHIVVIIKAVFF
jgi:hypothetical protein